MKKEYVIIFVFCFVFNKSYAQYQTRNYLALDSIDQFCSYFVLEEDSTYGLGWNRVLSFIKESDFVVLGEKHYSSQTSLLTKRMLPELSLVGYKNFGLEVGPISAKILQRLSANQESTRVNLREFNSKYFFKEDEAEPIPFFLGVEDAEFLAEASRLDFKLWGLDQEFYSSILYFIDEVISLTDNESSIVNMSKGLNERVYDYFINDIDKNGYKLFEVLMNDQELENFFDAAIAVNPEISKIVKALNISWDIYNRNSIRGGQSHQRRVSYMRRNFLEMQEEVGIDSKFFLKIGSLHASKGYSFNAYDVGNIINDYSIKHDKNSLHIRIVQRFYKNGNKVIDYSQNDPVFSSFGKKNEWTVIDLRELRQLMKSSSLSYQESYPMHSLKYNVENFDLILIPPVDRKQITNLN